MREELSRIDLSPIADLVRIKKEEQVLGDRLKGMENRAEKVSPAVYERVRKDYETRRTALEQESRPLKEHARGEYRRLQALRREVEQAVEAASFDKEEVDFRRELGEFPDGLYKERLAACEKRLADERQDLEAVLQMKATFLDAFRSEEDLETPEPAPRVVAPPVAPAPVVPAPSAATVVPQRPAPSADATVIGGFAAPPPASAPAAAPSADETVVRMSSPAPAAPSEDTETQGATIVMTRARLTLVEADNSTKEFPLKSGVSVIGRLAQSDIHLPTPDVSRKHAQIIVGPTGVFVVDLGSENGVVVNNKKVSKHQLATGDVILLGKQRLVFNA